MSGSQHLLLAAVQQAVATDPNFEYTTLLLPGNGTNGAQNNTFLDSSTNAFSITRNGNTTQGTFSPFSQTGWGNYFGGSDYINTPSDAKFGVGTGNFTLEAWVYITSLNGSSENNIIGNGSTNGFLLGFFGSSVYLASNATGYTVQITYTMPLNQWVHVAAVRSGTGSGQTAIYINGTSIGTGTFATNVPTGVAVVGGDYRQGTSVTMRGYVSNARISNTARYSGTFTPSIAPLTSDANTLLLTCQSNRFVDNAASPLAITVVGSPSVQAFSPFNPTAAWSASTNGGSGYFDGAGDFLTAPSTAGSLASGDFTVEGWIYCTSNPVAYSTIFSNYSSAGSTAFAIFSQFNSNGKITLYVGGSTYAADNAITFNAWTHVAAVRSSGTVKLYINGVAQAATATYSGAASGDGIARIGCAGDNPSGTNYQGYISSARWVIGTAVYTTNFAPPTAPLTAITNTSLLLNFTNAGIYDATSKNDLETVGNAQISTTQSKFGGSSMYFDGTGDWLSVPSGPNLTFDAGDFTVEAWVYVTSSSPNEQIIFSKRATTAAYSPVLIGIVKSGGVYKSYMIGSTTGSSWNINSSFSAGSATISLNTWTHLAVVRYGTTFTTYVNGVQDFQVTGISGSLTSNTAAVAVGASAANGDVPWFGYLDDYRITKGIARYTSTFTPPTAAFPLL